MVIHYCAEKRAKYALLLGEGKRKRMPHPGIRFFGIAVVCTYFAVM